MIILGNNYSRLCDHLRTFIMSLESLIVIVLIGRSLQRVDVFDMVVDKGVLFFLQKANPRKLGQPGIFILLEPIILHLSPSHDLYLLKICNFQHLVLILLNGVNQFSNVLFADVEKYLHDFSDSWGDFKTIKNVKSKVHCGVYQKHNQNWYDEVVI